MHDGAIAHDGYAVANANGLFQVVGDEDRGPFHRRCKLHEFRLQLASDERVQGAERLVHQQDVGICRDGARQAHALLHAARQLMRKAFAPAGQFNPRQRALCRFQTGLARHAANLQGHGHVVTHVAVWHQAKVLKHHGHAPVAQGAQARVVQRHHVLTIDPHRPRGGLQQTVDVAQKCALATARQTHDAKDLAARDGEADALHTHHAVKALQNLLLAQALALNGGKGFALTRAEDLPDGADINANVGGMTVHVLGAVVWGHVDEIVKPQALADPNPSPPHP